MRAQPGDELTVRGRQQGHDDRHGQIIEVHGVNGNITDRSRACR